MPKRISTNMNKTYFLFFLIAVFALPFCTTSRKAARSKGKDETMTSYAVDISPILQDRCTPCHFPGGGKRKFLDTYAAVSGNIDEILYRVQLPADSLDFMPFKSKKAPLSDSLIQVIKLWKAQNMPN
jgi:hypothetical protein